MDNPFDQFDAPVTSPASASPFGPRPVIQEGPPQPTPKDHFTPLPKTDPRYRPDYPSAQVDSTTGEVSYGPQASSEDTQGAQKAQAMEATRQLVSSIQKAKGYINDANNPVLGNTSTGLGYRMLSGAPLGPTDASQLKSTIKGEIQGNIFKSWMSAMKAATEKGGSAFGGRIMQSEIPFIVNSLGTLTPESLHTNVLLGNLDQVEKNVIRSAALLNNENPDDPKVLQKYQQMFVPPATNNSSGTPGAPGSTPGSTTPPPGGGSGGNPSDPNDPIKAELTRRLQSGEDPADTIHWLVSINRPPDKQTIQAIIANRGNQSPDVREQGLGHDFMVGLGGVAKGVGDLAGVVSNPFISLYDQATGSNIRPDMGANLRDELGLPAPEGNRENFIAAVNDYGTQGLGFANAARLAATRVPGVIGNALEALGNRPLTDAASGATGGAASELTRQAGGGPIAQTVAGIAGGVPTALAGNRIANALESGAREIPSVVNAGQQEGVTVIRAMADRSLQPKVVANGKTMAGAKIMGNQMSKIGSQIQNRVNALGDGGQPLDNYLLGERAQGIGTRYIKTSGQDFTQKYGALRTAAKGVPIPAQQSLQDIDGILERLNKAPETNANEINYLQGVRSDLARGLDVESARDIGSKMAAKIRKGDVTFGPEEANVLGIKNAISQDIANGLDNAGLAGVARSFKQVDGEYQQRMDFIHNVVQRLTGTRQSPLAPEVAAQRIQSWVKDKGGNSNAFQRIMAQAEPEERSDIAATFADTLGKDANGNPSTAALVKNTSKWSNRAKITAFGEDGAKSLDNLAQLAKEHARVTGALGGSPTALALDAKSLLRNVIFGTMGGGAEAAAGGGMHGLIGGAALGAGVTGAKVGMNALTARGLMSSKLTGLLRSAPASSDPAAINAWANRLKALAVREPALAPEIQRLQDSMVKAANQNITPAAAASGTDQSN